MKRSFLTIFSAVLILVSTAQTSKTTSVSKTSAGSSNSHSTSSKSNGNIKSSKTYSNSGSTSHSSNSSSSNSHAKSTKYTYSDPTSTVDNSIYVNDSKTKPAAAVANTETTNQNNTTNVYYSITPNKYKESNVIDDSYRQERGGITRVGIPGDEVVNYEERDKIAPEISQGDNSSTETITADSTPEKLSSDVKSVQTARKKVIVLHCDEYVNYPLTEKMMILQKYELYDLGMVQQCTPFKNEERWVISCAEFEKSSEERKNHIIMYSKFYDVSELIACDTYQEFIKE